MQHASFSLHFSRCKERDYLPDPHRFWWTMHLLLMSPLGNAIIAHLTTWQCTRCSSYHLAMHSLLILPLGNAIIAYLTTWQCTHCSCHHLAMHLLLISPLGNALIAHLTAMRRTMYAYWETLMQHQVHCDLIKFVTCYMRIV